MRTLIVAVLALVLLAPAVFAGSYVVLENTGTSASVIDLKQVRDVEVSGGVMHLTWANGSSRDLNTAERDVLQPILLSLSDGEFPYRPIVRLSPTHLMNMDHVQAMVLDKTTGDLTVWWTIDPVPVVFSDTDRAAIVAWATLHVDME